MFLIHKAFIGDVAIGSKYLPFAMSRVRQMYREKLLNTETFITDDARIRCHVIGEQGFVRIEVACEAYLEYGAIKIDGHSRRYLFEEAPGRVWLDRMPRIVSDAVIGTIRLPPGDPYISKLYGLKNPPTKLPVAPPPNPSNYRNDDGSFDEGEYLRALYPDQADLWNRKAALRFLEPSQATGKMRLFLQAITGSVIDRITPVFAKHGAVTDTILDNYLPLTPHQYLVRDDNGEYWLFDQKQRAYCLQFKPCGLPIKEELRKGGFTRERESELEAVLFSYIHVPPPSDAEYEKKKLNPYYIPDIEWVPYDWPKEDDWPALNADWHFPFHKMTAIKTGYRVIEMDPALWETKVMQATFHTSPSGDGKPVPPVMSVSITDVAKVALYAGQNIWFRDMYAKQQYPLLPVPRWEHIACDAAIYAFYDKDDIPIIVRFTKTKIDTTTHGPTMFEDLNIYGQGNQLYRTTRSAYTAGFYLSTGLSAVGETRLDDVITGITRETSEGGGNLDGFSRYPTTPNLILPVLTEPGVVIEFPPFTQVNSAYYAIRECSETNITKTGSTAINSAIVFPLNNPDAIYIGKSTRTERNGIETPLIHLNVPLGWSVNQYVGYIGWSPFGQGTPNFRWGDTVNVREITYTYNVSLVTQWDVIPITVPNQTATMSLDNYETVTPKTVWSQVIWPESEEIWFDDIHFRATESTNGRTLYNIEKDSYGNNGSLFPTDDYLIQFLGHA